MIEDRFMRMKEVLKCVGLGKSKVYAMIAVDEFPKPYRIGPNAVAWLESEVDAWIKSKVSQSKNAA